MPYSSEQEDRTLVEVGNGHRLRRVRIMFLKRLEYLVGPYLTELRDTLQDWIKKITTTRRYRAYPYQILL